jgi:hypothetical protein
MKSEKVQNVHTICGAFWVYRMIHYMKKNILSKIWLIKSEIRQMRSLKSSRCFTTCTVSLLRRGCSVELLPFSAETLVFTGRALVSSVRAVVAAGGADVSPVWVAVVARGAAVVGILQPLTTSASNCHRTHHCCKCFIILNKNNSMNPCVGKRTNLRHLSHNKQTYPGGN